VAGDLARATRRKGECDKPRRQSGPGVHFFPMTETRIEMKPSESESYLKFGRAITNKRYRAALSHLYDFISESSEEFEPMDHAFALQQIGLLHFFMKNTGVAKFYYKASLACDANSLINKIGYATFIGKHLRDKNLCESLCDEIIETAKKSPPSLFKNDMSAKYYIDCAEELKAEMDRGEFYEYYD
jgi:hypothetical protein